MFANVLKASSKFKGGARKGSSASSTRTRSTRRGSKKNGDSDDDEAGKTIQEINKQREEAEEDSEDVSLT